ncbi:NAD-dependent succinate-semialdehyde dehydrogenase [Flavobacterium jejuense]|uniref:NAD-dependent succinate-semialdehyde dehydrogenase n=1 Tax=Flavobacterium jejuense TaxID=1544455 RepID=A0ABX0J0L7_9FLAO|nr:NAD-dependent succinate-semialdehyde dehydrogenase [Flavobacterium jejuense]NHN27761.1 NAD-dependent succinate-semialdehyde dehydrogenase [Flavobacterium jejuense]
MSIKSINPYTLEVLKSYDEMTNKEVDAAITKAHTTYQNWKTKTFEEKATVLNKVAAILRLRKAELSKLITLEMGKLIAQAESEIEYAASIFEYYAKNGEEFLKDEKLEVEKGEAFIRKNSLGVLLGVEPWNFPFYQVARFAAPNIMIGNTILLKHASNVPQCAKSIEDIFKEAGAPSGLYTNLFIRGSKITKLIADKRIQGASLTGSEKAGSELAMMAGKYIKKSVLELGGSDAFIVLEDADIDRTVNLAILGRTINNGQSCIASKRFIVVEKVANEFLTKFKAKMSALQIGDPMHPETQLGPLSSEDALKTILEQVNQAVSEGAKIEVGGKRATIKGAFMEPTIISNITSKMELYQEELFGPVASFYVVKNEEEAIALANDTEFGLGGSIYTKDLEKAKKLANQIDSGMVFINHPTKSSIELPFGGTKRSGYGRELSPLGIDEFVNKKLIRVLSEEEKL